MYKLKSNKNRVLTCLHSAHTSFLSYNFPSCSWLKRNFLDVPITTNILSVLEFCCRHPISTHHMCFSVLRIRVRWIRKILASWIRIQGVKYQSKTAKKKTFLLLKSKFELLKKREIIKMSSFLNGLSEKNLNKKFKNLKKNVC